MEIVTVGIGQFGVNTNLQFWECMLMEYGIDKEGRQPANTFHADTCRHFRETVTPLQKRSNSHDNVESTGIFLPRAVMIDCDSRNFPDSLD